MSLCATHLVTMKLESHLTNQVDQKCYISYMHVRPHQRKEITSAGMACILWLCTKTDENYNHICWQTYKGK